MSNTEEKLTKSLTAEATELIPYPYLLQDLWDLGYSLKSIKHLISKHCEVSEKTNILDLGCGKGAVSVSLAKAFGCKVKGIDIMSEFIAYAKKKAEEYSVENLCEFKVEDINISVNYEKDYDIVILATVGNVLGNWIETVLKLKGTVKRSGYIFINDGFCDTSINETYPSRKQWLEIFRDAGLKLVNERILDKSEMTEINRYCLECMIKRANKLKKAHPEKEGIFEGFIRSQQAEFDKLEREITVVTWLLQVV